MPLPQVNAMWPPVQLQTITPSLQQWSAWYSGDPDMLRAAYGRNLQIGVGPQLAQLRAAQFRGFRGLLTRFWWGRPVQDITHLQRDMIHVPIAADLCQASADLLFADPPKLTVEKGATSTQDRLNELANDGMYTLFAEAAEVGAALGGVYLRVVWDKNLDNTGPFLTAVDADAAIPEFQWGRLTAVTFWTVIATDGNTTWRHLERHELNSAGVGIILHGLYAGNENNLGSPVPLTTVPQVPDFAPIAGMLPEISTESPGLAVVYVPNQRPQRKWRTDPLGVNLGRSDLDGIEGLMDALDEVYASWMRDIRLGKARIVVAKSLLDNLGAGKGSTFDAEQEIYSAVNALADVEGAGGLPIEQVQFAIRVAEHQQTAEQLVEDILRTAGYSTQTFGEGDTGSQRTATEIESRERRSLMTRERKMRLWRPALGQIIEKLLAVDKAIFNSDVVPQQPAVDWSDGVQETALALAQTVQALDAAGAASLETMVGIVHPDWDDDKIKAEVLLINKEKTAAAAAALPDPSTFGFPPPNPGQQQQQLEQQDGGKDPANSNS